MKRLWKEMQRATAIVTSWSLIFGVPMFINYEAPLESIVKSQPLVDYSPISTAKAGRAGVLGACPNYDVYPSSSTSNSTQASMEGSDFYKQCQAKAKPNWMSLYTQYARGSAGNFQNKAELYMDTPVTAENFERVTNDLQNTIPENSLAAGWIDLENELERVLNQVLDDSTVTLPGGQAASVCIPRDRTMASFNRKLVELANMARDRLYVQRKCWATLFLTTANRDLSKRENQAKGPDVSSFDGKISCSDLGPEVQDYTVCKTMVDAYQATQVAKKVHEMTQEVRVIDQNADIAAEVQEDIADNPLAGLEGQQKAIRNQADLARERSVADGTRMVVLGGFATQFPTLESVIAHCEQRMGNNETKMTLLEAKPYWAFIRKLHDIAMHVTNNVDYFNEYNADGDVEGLPPELSPDWPPATGGTVLTIAQAESLLAIPEAQEAAWRAAVFDWQDFGNTSQAGGLCGMAATDGTLSLIFNGAAQQQAVAAAAEAGIDAATNLAKGAILDKEADRLGDALGNVREFNPELLGFEGDEALAQLCSVEPGRPECAGLNLGGSFGFTNPGININGGSRATSDGTLVNGNGDDGANAASGGGVDDRSDILDNIGAPVTSIGKNGGLAGGVPGAARFKSGGPGQGGGGSASPGSPGGATLSQGGGGGGPVDSKDGAGNSSAAKYKGGGGANFAYSGGTGNGGGSASAKVDNPFAKLFDKKGQGGNKNGVLNFREPANIATKDSSLFGNISRRYSSVSRRGRLIDYESK